VATHTPSVEPSGQPASPLAVRSHSRHCCPSNFRPPTLSVFPDRWLIVLMPFLFWWNTWFGRQLSDKQIEVYLDDDKHPRHIQHALVAIE